MGSLSRVLANMVRRTVSYVNFLVLFLTILLGCSFAFVQTLGWAQVSYSAPMTATISAPSATVHSVTAENTSTAPVLANTTQSTVSTVTSAPVTSVQTVRVPSCTPDTSYSPPTAISPSQTGLQVILDTPNTYTVYGTSMSQIADQAAACTPVKSSGTGGFSAPFAASTANTVDWQTSYAYDSTTNSCSVSSVSITLHINQVFPQWQPTAATPASLSASWQAYSNEIHAYEQGHVLLDEQGAQKLLNDLEQFPETSCETINQAVNEEAQADVAATLTANTAYDQTNNFGPNL